MTVDKVCKYFNPAVNTVETESRPDCSVHKFKCPAFCFCFVFTPLLITYLIFMIFNWNFENVMVSILEGSNMQ